MKRPVLDRLAVHESSYRTIGIDFDAQSQFNVSCDAKKGFDIRRLIRWEVTIPVRVLVLLLRISLLYLRCSAVQQEFHCFRDTSFAMAIGRCNHSKLLVEINAAFVVEASETRDD